MFVIDLQVVLFFLANLQLLWIRRTPSQLIKMVLRLINQVQSLNLFLAMHLVLLATFSLLHLHEQLHQNHGAFQLSFQYVASMGVRHQRVWLLFH